LKRLADGFERYGILHGQYSKNRTSRMRRFLAWFAVLCLTGIPLLRAQTQKVYDWAPKRIWPVWAAGAVTAAASLVFDARTSLPSSKTLDASRVFSVDRCLLPQVNHNTGRLSDGLLLASLSSGALMAWTADRQHRWTYLGIWSGTLFLTGGLTQLTKAVVRRARPSAYRQQAAGEPLTRETFRSFFSGHTALAAASVACGSVLWLNTHSEKWTWPAITSVMVLGSGLNRLLGGYHYLTDVLTGALVGTALGLWVPQLHEKETLGPLSAPMVFHFQFRF